MNPYYDTIHRFLDRVLPSLDESFEWAYFQTFVENRVQKCVNRYFQGSWEHAHLKRVKEIRQNISLDRVFSEISQQDRSRIVYRIQSRFNISNLYVGEGITEVIKRYRSGDLQLEDLHKIATSLMYRSDSWKEVIEIFDQLGEIANVFHYICVIASLVENRQ